MPKLGLIVFNAAIFVFLSSVTAGASWQADCINPGVCSTRICVATRDRALWRCQIDCGRLARTRAIRASNCMPR